MVAATHRIPEAEAAARLPELIDRLIAGEGILIERDDATQVRLEATLASQPGSTPGGEPEPAEPQRRDAVEVVKEIQRELGGMFGDATLEEVLSWKHKGHRYG